LIIPKTYEEADNSKKKMTINRKNAIYKKNNKIYMEIMLWKLWKTKNILKGIKPRDVKWIF